MRMSGYEGITVIEARCQGSAYEIGCVGTRPGPGDNIGILCNRAGFLLITRVVIVPWMWFLMVPL
jgi:hypothetical protein